MTPPRDCDITEPNLREDVSRIERGLEDAPTRQILVVEGTHDGAAVSSLGIRQTRVQLRDCPATVRMLNGDEDDLGEVLDGCPTRQIMV
jgi:hypothetical protein